jgi:hypothetical protein
MGSAQDIPAGKRTYLHESLQIYCKMSVRTFKLRRNECSIGHEITLCSQLRHINIHQPLGFHAWGTTPYSRLFRSSATPLTRGSLKQSFEGGGVRNPSDCRLMTIVATVTSIVCHRLIDIHTSTTGTLFSTNPFGQSKQSYD